MSFSLFHQGDFNTAILLAGRDGIISFNGHRLTEALYTQPLCFNTGGNESIDDSLGAHLAQRLIIEPGAKKIRMAHNIRFHRSTALIFEKSGILIHRLSQGRRQLRVVKCEAYGMGGAEFSQYTGTVVGWRSGFDCNRLLFWSTSLIRLTVFASISYLQGEGSNAYTGLGNRWIIKSVLAFGILCLLLSAVAGLIRNVAELRRGGSGGAPHGIA